MPKVIYNGAEYACNSALMGDDFVHLLDAHGTLIAAFDNVTDFSGFEIQNGVWKAPVAPDNCYLAVIGEDGKIRKGGHRCSDISLILSLLSLTTTQEYQVNGGTAKVLANGTLFLDTTDLGSMHEVTDEYPVDNPWDAQAHLIREVHFKDNYVGTDISGLCCNMQSMVEPPKLPSSVKVLAGTFNGCTSLVESPVLHQGITDISYAFVDCNSLSEPPVLPSGLWDMSGAFMNCGSLRSIPTIPASVGHITHAFEGCGSLQHATGLSSGTCKFTDMASTFAYCDNLISVSAIPSGVGSLHETFYGCEKLKSAPAIPEGVVNLYGTFQQCYALTTPPAIPSSAKTMECMFFSCDALLYAPELPYNAANANINFTSMFEGCNELVAPPSIIPKNAGSIRRMFYNCHHLSGTITIACNFSSYDAVEECFSGAASDQDSVVTLNYTRDAEHVVDYIIATKDENSNIIKGSLVSV